MTGGFWQLTAHIQLIWLVSLAQAAISLVKKRAPTNVGQRWPLWKATVIALLTLALHVGTHHILAPLAAFPGHATVSGGVGGHVVEWTKLRLDGVGPVQRCRVLPEPTDVPMGLCTGPKDLVLVDTVADIDEDFADELFLGRDLRDLGSMGAEDGVDVNGS